METHPMNDTPPPRWNLRDLPMSARVTIAAFLISVGVGYFSAIVQLHFQHAQPGSMLPTGDDAVRIFHGHVGADPISTFERLLTEEENKPFNGSGQMVAAFTKRSEPSLKAEVKKRSKPRRGVAAKPLAQIEKEVLAERMGERDVFVAWVKDGADEQALKDNSYCPPDELQTVALTEKYEGAKNGKARTVKIGDLFKDRCVRCHQPQDQGGDPLACKFPFHVFDKVKPFTVALKAQPMSLEKLAQTTHVHLLAFSMLYMITGLLLALSPLPGYIRFPLAPLPLIAQVIDIACWWLARIDGDVGVGFAKAIPITGMIVGVGLGLHILLTLFSMFRLWGWVVLVALMAGAAYGGHVAMEMVIKPHMASENPPAKAE
jgi:hypothetical protein